MKYCFEIKKEIYKKHCEGYGSEILSKEYGIESSKIRYMCRLVDKHGLEAIWHKFTKYSSDYKLVAIKRVLENGESVESVAVDLGLAADGILRQWIKSYIENGYNVVTKKKGRPSTRDKEKKTVEELEKENELLREQLLKKTVEAEYLKKLYALTHGEEKKKKNN